MGGLAWPSNLVTQQLKPRINKSIVEGPCKATDSLTYLRVRPPRPGTEVLRITKQYRFAEEEEIKVKQDMQVSRMSKQKLPQN